MLPIEPASASKPTVQRTFIIRLTWDRASATGCILLKSVDGKEVRLFADVEAACLYLEAMLRPEERS